MLKKLKLKVKNDKNLHERIRVIAPDTIPTGSKSMHPLVIRSSEHWFIVYDNYCSKNQRARYDSSWPLTEIT